VNASAGEQPLHAAGACARRWVVEATLGGARGFRGSPTLLPPSTHWPAFAALYGHCEVARTLLELGAKVNAVDKAGRTVLHCAATHGQAEAARVFLEAGCEVDARTKGNLTALALAVQGCHVEVAQVLLSAGANPFLLVASPPLLSAAARGDSECVRLLLSCGCDARAAHGGAGGRTALHEASTAEVARLLLAAGADVGCCDAQGRTAMHGRQDGGPHPPAVLQALLAAGGDVNAADSDGCVPLHYAGGCAALCGAHAALSCAALLAAGAAPNRVNKLGRAALHSVLDAESFEYSRGNGEASEQLLAAAAALLAGGASLDTADATGTRPLHTLRQADRLGAPHALVTRAAAAAATGWSPLHAAAAAGDAPRVKALLDHLSQPPDDAHAGSLQDTAAHVQRLLRAPDVQGRAAGGETALRCASAGGHLAAVTQLLACGAGERLREEADAVGCTPLHAAAGGGHAQVCAALIACGADVNALDANKRTPLLAAASGGHYSLCRTLVEQHGALVNVNYGHGATLLFVTAQRGGEGAAQLAQLLMAKGANHLTATYTGAPSHGRSPLSGAAAAGHTDLAKLLIERGGEVKETDWAGYMPLDGVVHPDMRRLLRSYDADVQRVMESKAAVEAQEKAEKEAAGERQRVAAQQEAAERAELEESAARAAVAASAAAATAAEAARRRMEDEARKARLDGEAARRAGKAAEEATRAAEEEAAWRERALQAQAAEDAARRAEEEEAAILAALSCPACVARMRRDAKTRKAERGPVMMRALANGAMLLLGAMAGATAATYMPQVQRTVRQAGETVQGKRQAATQAPDNK